MLDKGTLMVFNVPTLNKEPQMKTTMLMTRNNETREVEIEAMFGRPGEFSVYPFCITKSDLEAIGFKFHNIVAEAA